MGRGVRDRRGESVIRFVAPGRAFYPDRCCATAQKKNAFSPPSIRSVRTWNPEEWRSWFFFSFSSSSSNVSLIRVCTRPLYAADLWVFYAARLVENAKLSPLRRVSYKRSSTYIYTTSSRRIEIIFKITHFVGEKLFLIKSKAAGKARDATIRPVKPRHRDLTSCAPQV